MVKNKFDFRTFVEQIKSNQVILVMSLLACIMIHLIHKDFYQQGRYEVNTLIEVSPLVGIERQLDGIENTVRHSYYQHKTSIDLYAEKIMTPQVLNKVINKLNLSDENGAVMSYDLLEDKIDVIKIKNTNMIIIRVEGEDAREIVEIANTITSVFAEVITEDYSKLNSDLANQLEAQLNVELENVKEKNDAIIEYIKEGVNIEQLSQEVSYLSNQVTSTKLNIGLAQEKILQNEIALEVLKNDLSERKDKNYLTLTENNRVQESMLTIERTKIETNLLKNQSELESLQIFLDSREKNLREKSMLLEKEKYIYGMLQNDLALAIQTYEAYLKRHKEVVVLAASDLGSASTTIIFEALEPLEPNKNHYISGIVSSGVIGIFSGLCIIFVKESFKSAN